MKLSKKVLAAKEKMRKDLARAEVDGTSIKAEQPIAEEQKSKNLTTATEWGKRARLCDVLGTALLTLETFAECRTLVEI